MFSGLKQCGGGGDAFFSVKFGAAGNQKVIGPSEESAVWIDELPAHNFTWCRRTLVQSILALEDPLRLCTEGYEQTNFENLRELFPNNSGDLWQDNFSPSLFLLEKHSATPFDDLKAGLNALKRKIESQKEDKLLFLKLNTGSIIDLLDTLINTHDKLQKNQKQFGPEPLNVLKFEIKNSIAESESIFADILLRKEQVYSTKAILMTLSRHRFLLCLPNSLVKNAATGDYDIVLKDYTTAKRRFGRSKIPIFRKIMDEVDQRVLLIRKQLHANLIKMPQRVEQQRKLMQALISLEVQQSGNNLYDKLPYTDPVWDVIETRAKFLEQTFKQTFEQYVRKDAQRTESTGIFEAMLLESKNRYFPEISKRVLFCKEICEIAASQLPDLWRLGQMYFKRELRSPNHTRLGDFKRLILNAIKKYCIYLKVAMCAIDAEALSLHKSVGLIWPMIYGSHDISNSWLPLCLGYTREAYDTLSSFDLPSSVFDIMQKLIDETRLHILCDSLERATQKCTQLAKMENWKMVVENFPGATVLPQCLEELLIEALEGAQKACFNQKRKANRFEPEAYGQLEVPYRLQKLFFCFSNVIQELALNSPEDTRLQEYDYTNPNGSPLDIFTSLSSSAAITWGQRMLCCLANCAYCNRSFFPNLEKLFEKYGYSLPPFAFHYSTNKLFYKLLNAYVKNKGDTLVNTIEFFMYLDEFQWNTEMSIGQLSPYARECWDILIGVYFEIFSVTPALLRPILEPIVLAISKKLASLMSCVRQFSYTGAIQASVDIRFLKDALRLYTNEAASNYFLKALEAINPSHNAEQQKVADNILEKVKNRMKLQRPIFE